jgi:hypothetical protein
VKRTLWLIPLCFAWTGCDNTGLYRGQDPPPKPDTGVEEPDAGFADDAGFVDAAVPDAGEPPPAREPVYIHTGETLYSYDPETNTTAQIARFSDVNGPLTEDIVDIAIDLNGRMFGGSNLPGNNSGQVYQIDPVTGFCTQRFSFNDVMNGMTFLPSGPLVVAGKRISVIDTSNGRMIREFEEAADMYETSGDIVGLPDGNLYWTVRGDRSGGGNPSDRVVRINPNSGSITVIGDAQIDRIYGLGYAEGSLYGFSSAGLVVQLNPGSGVVLDQKPLTGRWFGATTNPVLW